MGQFSSVGSYLMVAPRLRRRIAVTSEKVVLRNRNTPSLQDAWSPADISDSLSSLLYFLSNTACWFGSRRSSVSGEETLTFPVTTATDIVSSSRYARILKLVPSTVVFNVPDVITKGLPGSGITSKKASPSKVTSREFPANLAGNVSRLAAFNHTAVPSLSWTFRLSPDAVTAVICVACFCGPYR